MLVACLATACSSSPAQRPQPPADDRPPPLQNFHNTCDFELPFTNYQSQLFVATDTQLERLFECRYLGLTREHDEPKAGSCLLADHSNDAVAIPLFNPWVLHHLGHVLDAPIVYFGPPTKDSAVWPTLTMDYVGASSDPLGNLWHVPKEYLDLLARLRDTGGEAAAGDALAAHLQEFNHKLRAYIPNQACRSLMTLLVDFARKAKSENAGLYLLGLTKGV